ncbi:CAF17-like 4Fe-4S cluster assembly/insertion protein YgfZ [Haloplanus aerogenes]|uniref:Aminomethyl transferase family protein n=1 Tax=Haloplanus aerogenes TaxID=660522 RepID=A0A3M0CVC2_9EURY|nr:aminomethyltransferase family protein [Haloplanus aerogenes]AZH26889.1 aminomethyl transferase family protein [Haloplanus aerogenes]RMB12540.1 aminomethyltransferase [Haloplanus aerogenes]
MIRGRHADYGAEFETRGGRDVVAHYGRPERTHLAVRNGVGVIEMGYGVVVVEGSDAVDFVDNAVSNRVPAADGEGCYALLLDPQGGIETDLYVYNAGERLLCFTPPDRADPLAADWSEKVFIQDVSIRDASDEFGVFGVHGPTATETVATLFAGSGAPEEPLTFARGAIADAGVTVVSADDPTGETGYEVICRADDADDVWDSLLTRGTPTTPVGYRTWDTLTLEAGTPLFDTELAGRIPNVAGVRNALDFDKGCYVGQEVVSRVENQGRPSKRLVGLELDAVPDSGAAVMAGDAHVGDVTRGAESPSLSRPIALAYAESGVLDDSDPSLTVRVDGDEVDATVTSLPFVEGSGRSARLPRYSD